MSRHTENREELLKVHGEIDLIKQKLDTLENNHLAHIKKDIDRILYILAAVGVAVLGELFVLLNKVL
jgi:Mg2+ and Co2+ transporter CorA